MGKKSRRSKNKHKPKGGDAASSTATGDGSTPSPLPGADEVEDAATPPGAAASSRTSSGAPFAPRTDGINDEPQTPPPSAVCWICLDGGPDEGGKPIVRECSCRGDDAGFVHFSCLVNYAESKTKQRMNKRGEVNFEGLIEPWIKCPTCRQHYQRWFSIDLAKLYVTFMEKNFSTHQQIKLFKLDGFQYLLITIHDMDYAGRSALRKEAKRAAQEMLSEIEGIDEITKETYKDFIEARRVIANMALANFAAKVDTQDGCDLALQYYERVRNSYISEGNEREAMEIAANMEFIKAMRPSTTAEEALEPTRHVYDKISREDGDDATSVQLGIHLSQQLHSTGHCLECERLLNHLEAVSHRILGPDHPLTKIVKTRMEFSRRRMVAVQTDSGVVECEALRFNSDTNTYEVEGEVPDRATEQVGLDMLVMPQGTPVICHGLKNARHLNGKIGDVMRYDDDACRYEVRFEHKSLKPASVKAANLRILFDLPDKQ